MSPDQPSVTVAEVQQAQLEINAENDRNAKAGLEVWAMHSRKCRRNLEFRYGVKPRDLWGQVRLCTCGWPEQRLREEGADA